MEKLKKQKLIINLIFMLFGIFAATAICCFLYITLNNKMNLVSDYFGMSIFELFWYSPYIGVGLALIFFIIYVVILSLKSNIESKINSIYFENGRKFKYNRNGINVVISKDTGWFCYKNSDFVKDDFSIDISSCEPVTTDYR
ncbi:hypothetical protein [Aliarcobacter butzleri]|uniref:hypothetical protein n=1 Tax=Aliarcobacter butzleri TaxID=28197 RepID=UPI00126A176F|nr:hypothetical protein [Aliarcobacter butzleri]